MQEFEDAESAARTVAAVIRTRLCEGLARRGRASLVVSGGSSPKRLYEHVSMADLDWSCVHIVLADERWVDPGAPGSNERFIRATLLQNRATQAVFVGLKTEHNHPGQALAGLEARLQTAPAPFDAVVLGMGTDGHTLSWFPDADGLVSALDPEAGCVASITAQPSPATGPFVERVTLTRKALKGARFCALLINGSDKRRVLQIAENPGEVSSMPVRAVLRDTALDLQTYWWP